MIFLNGWFVSFNKYAAQHGDEDATVAKKDKLALALAMAIRLSMIES